MEYEAKIWVSTINLLEKIDVEDIKKDFNYEGGCSMVKKFLFDTNAFNKLILLTTEDMDKLSGNFELLVADVSAKELSRMKEGEGKNKILGLIEKYFKVIPAGVFTFASYTDKVHEDSAVGFARYGSENKGRWLRYEDAGLVKEIGMEKNKILKGTAFNDTAIALAIPKDAIFVTDEQKGYGNKLNRLGIRAISFEEFLSLNGMAV